MKKTAVATCSDTSLYLDIWLQKLLSSQTLKNLFFYEGYRSFMFYLHLKTSMPGTKVGSKIPLYTLSPKGYNQIDFVFLLT